MAKFTYTPVKKEGDRYVPAGPSRELDTAEVLRDPSGIINPAAIERARRKTYEGIGAILRGETPKEGSLTPGQEKTARRIVEMGASNSGIKTLLARVREAGDLFRPQTQEQAEGTRAIVNLAKEDGEVGRLAEAIVRQTWYEQGIIPNQPFSIDRVKFRETENGLQAELSVKPRPDTLFKLDFHIIDLRGRVT
jgi:hypothetical protein